MAVRITRGPIQKPPKFVVYGPEGIGKSTLVSQFPGALFIDTEGSTTYMDVARLDTPESWEQLLGLVRNVRDERPPACGTLVVDTLDWAEMLCIRSVCAKKHVDGIEDMGYGKGYVYLAEEFGKFLNLLSELVERGIGVAVTAHAKMRKVEQPDAMGAYDRWEMKLQPKTAALVKEWADILLFANYKTYPVAVDKEGKKFKAQGGKRVLYTSHHACWDAKNRMGLPEELPLEYPALTPLFEKMGAAAASSSLFPPSPAASPAPHRAASAPASAPAPAPVTENPAAADSPPTPPVQSASPQADPAPVKCAADPNVTVTERGYMDSDGHPLKDALQELFPLMEMDQITAEEVQDAIARKGYFPAHTPLTNLPDDFIRGVLIGAWEQVKAMVEQMRPDEDLPF